MARKPGRPNPELAKPRVVHGRGPMPTHISYIFADSSGSYRVQIHERGTLRGRLGLRRELTCADKAEYDAQMAFMIAARVPFMVGHMIPGPSDDAWFWLKEKGLPVDYLEISCGGRTEWQVREIFEGAKAWRGVKPEELLGPDIDLFAPENRPRVEHPDPPSAPSPETPPATPVEVPPAVSPVAPEPAPHAPPSEPTAPPSAPPEPPAAASPTPAATASGPPPPIEPLPDAAPSPEPAEPPSPVVVAAPPAPVEAEAPGLKGQRAVEYGSVLLLVLLLGISFWRATGYFGLVVPFEPAPMFTAMAEVALVFGLVYTAAWMTLFPRHFARWSQRLLLLALALTSGALIAFLELMIANIRYDDAPRIVLQTTVAAKTIFKGKSGRNLPEHWTWHLSVESWTTPGEEQTLQVSRATWDEVDVGRRIVFQPHPGRFGWVWYSRDEFEAPDFVRILPP
jgi:hypothetical protein